MSGAAAAPPHGRAPRRAHAATLSGRISSGSLNTSCLYRDLSGRPLLLPVYIGAYRRGDSYYRVVINGQTGELTGKAPMSWLKILGAIVAGAGCLLAIVVFITLIGVIGSQL